MAPPDRYPDHVQALRLLWRGEEQPAARSGLTVAGIVEAAVEVAHEAGLAAVTMRRLGERLGVGAMSLYRYVPGRDELVMLMQDAAWGELPTTSPDDATWRDRLTTMAQDLWELYERHPWLLDVPVSRPVAGPNTMDRWEHELSAVDGIGLDDLEMNGLIELIHWHVAGAADQQRAIRRDAEASGMTDDEWWYHVLPTLTQVLSDRSYPLSARVGAALGAPHTDPRYILEFGLDRILDGVDALLADRRG